jgi:hypothetical protein
MRSRSANGSSTPTSRRTDPFRDRRLLPLAVIIIPVAGVYVIEAFVAPNPLLRIALRTIPVLPIAVWTLWFDPAHPFERQPAALRFAGRIALLLLVMTFAVALLGIGLNWLYDPGRVI